MRLFILRHAEAEPGADNDPGRRLTPRGELQARSLAHQFESVSDDFQLLSSPWLRAVETASKLLAGNSECVTTYNLTPAASVIDAGVFLESCFQASHTLVVVTHQPLCGRLINWLVDGRDQSLSIAPCNGALLELDWPAAGMARLVRWIAPETSL
ncbi:SixA phosphatase family protein [Marinobacterium sediminicola]|uniref:Phosphohistidine phosphatase, SixA n=1 Tax=Marinobacterium sediminicola TaxID=518898 RepID=A0ABY1RVL9_9GAMM|nr:histidine phosphatase family protein [Marinobacterium sediminicola]ULG70610.1 histidine phosphatase family protein [Marinobacterium sediminicola]SMR68882.1 phosphohistidine phosphatase, SixA [Marinobacterium sediminicola]